MKNDQLLSQFDQFQIASEQLEKIKGGNITGCAQDGGNSYIDSPSLGCDYKVGSNDLAGWCAALMK